MKANLMRIAFWTILLCIHLPAKAQTSNKEIRWDMVIKPQFDDFRNSLFDSYAFSDGFARVSVQGKYGYINKEGKFVINPIYDDATDFKDGAAIACIEQKCGIIDRAGKKVTNFIFDRPITLYPFSDGLAIVKKDGKSHYIDAKGNLVLPNDYVSIFAFYNGYAAVSKYMNDDFQVKYGVIDKKGRLAVDFIFDSIGIFREGLATFKNGNSYGYINTDGSVAIDPQFVDAYPFKEGLAAVAFGQDCGINKEQKCKYGFINKSGYIVINPIYDLATRFNDGLAYALSKNKVGYINLKGETVIPFEFDSGSDFSGGYARVSIRNKHGIIDSRGNIVVPLIFEDISLSSEGLIGVKTNGKWGFIKIKRVDNYF